MLDLNPLTNRLQHIVFSQHKAVQLCEKVQINTCVLCIYVRRQET